MFSSAWFAENVSKNSSLDNSGISLPVFTSRTNLKLHIFVIPKMVRKVIMNLDLAMASGPDCVPVVVLKNCEPELSYILAGLKIQYVSEGVLFSRFLEGFNVSKNVEEWSRAQNYCPISLLSVVCR